MGQVIDPNQALLKAAATGQSSGYVQSSKLHMYCIFHCYKLHQMADMNTEGIGFFQHHMDFQKHLFILYLGEAFYRKHSFGL